MRNEASERPGRRALAILALACGVALLPSALAAGFLNFDDPRLFGARSELADGGLLRVFDPTATILDAYLPVSRLSLWFDRAVFGDRPLGPHLHSFVLHVLVAFCVARLGFRLGLTSRAATAAAAVFAIHPALCESALWVRGREELLAGLFVTLALSTIVRHARGGLGARAAVGWTTAFAVLAMYSKGTAVVLPLLAGAVVWLVRERGQRRASAPLMVATFAVAILVGIHHALVATGTGAMAPAGGLGERLAQVPGAFLHYLTTALWPFHLNVAYPEVATLEAFRAALLPGLVALAAYGGGVVWLARRQPRVAAGLALFALALAPFNTAFPASSIAAADRYLYLALPGLAFALAAVPRWGAGLAAAAAVPLVILCHGRAADFESSAALWNSSLAVEPDNALALINLAPVEVDPDPLAVPFVGRVTVSLEALARAERRLERALEVGRYPQHRLRAAVLLADLARASQRFERAARYAALAAAAADELDLAQPGAVVARVETHLQAARLARTDGDLDAARRHFAEAAGIAPDHPFVLCFTASLLQAEAMDAEGGISAGDPRLAEAEALLERAEAQAPELYELHWTRGDLARASGRLIAAEKNFRRATTLEPTRRDAWRSRADMFLAQGMAGTAESVARDGLQHVDDPGLRFRLALALTAAGKIDEARLHYETYLALRPDDPQARAGLASVLSALGMRQLYQLPPDAIDKLADRIVALDPTHPKARMMKAVAARGRHDLIGALVLLESVREQMGGDPEVAQLYAETLRDRGWQLKLQEDRPDAAFDRFREFLDVAPAGVPTEAVANAVLQEWVRQLEAGKQALVAGDPKAAERRFRRCDELRPAQSVDVDYYRGLALFAVAGDDRLDEALACFERAEALQRDRDADPGLAVLYQVRALQRLGRDDEASTRARALLDAGQGVAEDVLERLRATIER